MKKTFAYAVLFTFMIASFLIAQTQTQPQSQSQPEIPSTDIFLARLASTKDVSRVEGAKNITKRPGYDNQPYFLPDGSGILYTVIDDSGQADIYKYIFKSDSRERITDTKESEYSPTLTPDRKHVSVVRVEADGTQRLWQFPLAGGPPSLLAPNVKPVGYHAWIDSNTVVVYVLGEPSTLQRIDLATGTTTILAKNIGRCLQKKPGTSLITFVQMMTQDKAVIRSYDPKSGTILDVTGTLPGSEDYAWSPGGALLMGKGAKLFSLRPGNREEWEEIADFSADGIHGISRLAINSSGDRIALVSESK